MILDFDTALTRKILAERAEAQARMDRERNARAEIAEQIDRAHEAIHRHGTDPSQA